MSVIKITNENFESEVVNAGKTVLIDFFANWCGPCKMMGPIVDEIAKENSNISVGKVDVDEEQELAMKYGVMSIPTFIVFKDGKIAGKSVGAASKQEILNLING